MKEKFKFNYWIIPCRMWSGAVSLWDGWLYTRYLALWWDFRLHGWLWWTRLPWVTNDFTHCMPKHAITTSVFYLTISYNKLCVYSHSSGNMWWQSFPVFEWWWVHPRCVGVRWWGRLRGWLRWEATLSWVLLPYQEFESGCSDWPSH